ncbi:GDSL family lipase [Galbibacter marinus]|uniref:GDSL family lipase n=1 Tax=Galbibacter marinus TaxID=555500 RepID=K2P5R2_9FLAO|nr:rhamnogalacturonan acetylesterase [Galbibacter marinus]EKF56288.1 GDSL family lipase [Galbibacter marinus]
MRFKIYVVAVLGILFSQCQPSNTTKKPVLYTVGDSTVKNGQGDGAGGLWGWGDFINQYLDTTQITVKNRALGGTSSRTYIQKGLWQQVYQEIEKGDYVLIQFGHNDSGPINDDFRARGTIKGIGDQKEEIHNMLTNEDEVVHTYGWYIRKMVQQTKEKGGIPIVISPIPRNKWKNGTVERNFTTYGLWSKQVAQQEGVTFIDLNRRMALVMELIGEEKIYDHIFYKKDHTHPTADGAALAAIIVVTELKSINKEFVKYVLEDPKIKLPPKKQLYLIGDSTVANNGLDEAVGWGAVLAEFVDTTRVRIVNAARGGRSSRTFYSEKLWEKVYDSLQKGDYVLMQFGHNDGGHIDQPKYRGSIPGISDSTIVVKREDHPDEKVHSYGWYMDHFVKQTLDKGAIAVVLSPIPRNRWKGDKVIGNKESYGLWAKEIANKNKVTFIDLNDSIARAYQNIGPDKVSLFFPKDHTHTNRDGAIFNAAILTQSLRRSKKLGLKDFLVSKQTIKEHLSNVLQSQTEVKQ